MLAFVRQVSISACAALLLFGCARSGAPPVVSHLSGRITVASEIDSSGDYSGFKIVVASLVDDRVDTLGVGTTAPDGTFSMNIEVGERGVYPLTIRRHGGLLKQGQIVVVDGDSATMSLQLPTGRPMTIRSAENGAWMAYRNTKAAHAANIRRMAGTGSVDPDAFRMSVMQTANVLWSLGDTYPGTLGSTLGSVESVVMLATWDDSLVISRLHQLPLETPGIVGAIRAGWRAVERRSGLDSALATIDRFRSTLPDPEAKSALLAERVVALMDGGRVDDARVEADLLVRSASVESGTGSDWRTWAESAIYEIDNLRPGLRAPGFSSLARDGSQFDLEEFSSGLVLLEFYVPESEEYQQDLALRMHLNGAPTALGFQIVSVSLQPDPDLNDAFIDSRNLPGVHIVAEGGAEGDLARLYNVRSVPKRFLIRDGVIVAKYHGRALAAAVRDAESLAKQPA